MSPTARTLNLLREQGWKAGVVERWNPHSKTRHDLYGFADISAIKAGVRGTLYVQATSDSNHSSRKAKLLKCAEVAIALSGWNTVEIWSWGLKGPRGARKKWMCRVESLSLSDFIPEAA